eukprot:snap_masked-scaffold_4-processed-gene-21.20-mRNA-1 protein AED:1.00 eAED:1.00 QI:0/0/0/0/1/1/2/0/79
MKNNFEKSIRPFTLEVSDSKARKNKLREVNEGLKPDITAVAKPVNDLIIILTSSSTMIISLTDTSLTKTDKTAPEQTAE